MAPRVATATVLLAALVAHVAPALSTLQVVTATLGARGDGPSWQFVSKFGFGVGVSEFRARVRQVRREGEPHAGGVELALESFLDERWPEAEAIEDPCRRRQPGEKASHVTVGSDGDWGPVKIGTMSHRVRPHVWYFALSACQSRLPNGTFTLELELDARQPDGSHFSIESTWSERSALLALLACSALLLRFWRSVCRVWSSVGELHPVVRTLAGVVASQYVAQLLHIAHLAMYRKDGRGSPTLEALGEALIVTSEVAETTLLIAIAMGYTLKQSTLGGDLGLFVPVVAVTAVVHIGLVVLEKVEGEASHKFTSHDGVKGWAFLAFRLALFAWFLLAARATAASEGLKLHAFLRQFRLAASVYFLAYPAAMLLLPIFAPYWRRAVVEFVLMVARVCANLWLSSLFLGRGAYFEVSSLGATLLPSGSRSCSRFLKGD